MRNDGDYTIYLIEVRSNGDWVEASFGHFGTPPVTGPAGSMLSNQDPVTWKKSNDYVNPPGTVLLHSSVKNGFSACGDCWQKTGFHGTCDFEAGLEGLRNMARKHPDREWRLVRRRITQTTVVLSYMKWPQEATV